MAAETEQDGNDILDPDYIAEHPPAKVCDAKQFFQIGDHDGKWSEFDERGVPTKNIKKKKLTKKEKEQLESDYLEATKAYQKYLKAIEDWEQSKLTAERNLKKTDRLRWSFRQIGDKDQPIEAEDMEQVIKLMGWTALSPKELKIVKKGVGDVADSDGLVDLRTLRAYVKDTMPIQLLEDRLLADALDTFMVDQYYSPRTWRKKVEDDPPPMRKVKGQRGGRKTTKKITKKLNQSTSMKSVATEGTAEDASSSRVSSASPRTKAKKRTQKIENKPMSPDGSPRGSSSPRRKSLEPSKAE